MRRILILALLAASPATAWEFTAIPFCTLSHATDTAEARVTYDPRQADPYAIALTLTGPWQQAPVFAIAFQGAASLTISTSRHRISPDGRTLSVSDTGFGNVLNGLEFNTTATAISGNQAVSFPLENAAPAVREFRACAEGGIA